MEVGREQMIRLWSLFTPYLSVILMIVNRPCWRLNLLTSAAQCRERYGLGCEQVDHTPSLNPSETNAQRFQKSAISIQDLGYLTGGHSRPLHSVASKRAKRLPLNAAPMRQPRLCLRNWIKCLGVIGAVNHILPQKYTCSKSRRLSVRRRQ